MSDSCMGESPKYLEVAQTKDLFVAQARCPNCDTLPMIEIAGGELLCPKCRKQYYEGPNHNFVRHVYEFTEDVPNPLFKADIKKGCSKRTVEKVKKDFKKIEEQTKKARKVSAEALNRRMDF